MLAELRKRYEAALHAMQSGVALAMNFDAKATEPKHLRTGVNAAMSDGGGLVKLLVEKGVFSEEEYYRAVAEAMEREVATYEKIIATEYGRPVKLK